MTYVAITSKYLFEGVLFLLIIVLLFNSFTDFAEKLGILSIPLNIEQVHYFGFLAIFIAILNLMSDKFFGFSFVK
ncbi:MAG: hypothetical protein AABX98_01310 [Nanoarchaeota archaeon]|mgnify:FL=1